jgi:DNA repair protein RecO (recombination protein O)
MEWTDEGIVLGVRRHGESSAIVELLTRSHGRHLGLVRGGAGSRMRPLLQPGNSVSAVWRARLDEHLGYYLLEGTRMRAATMLASSHAVYGITHLASLARLLPERDPHEDIYEMLERTLDDFDDIGEAAVHLVKFELAMLAELGFGLDLETCAATGQTSELIYVSPKSGGAVSRVAGDPWRERLLRLPAFLRAHGETDHPSLDQASSDQASLDRASLDRGWSDQDLQDGFHLTGLFLLRHVLEPRGQGHSDAREGFINAVTRHRATVRSG